MHMVNMPSFLETVVNLFKSFLNEKMKNRFQIHAIGDYSKLHDSVGKDVLPEELGGTNGKLQEHIGKNE